MARNGSGIYSLPLPPVEANTVISTSWANATLTDIAQAVTDSLPRNGEAGMIGPFKLADGSQSQPSFSFNGEATTGLYRPAASILGASVGGVERWRTTTNGLIIGRTTDTGEKLQVAGHVKITGAVSIDGSTAVGGDSTVVGNLTVGGGALIGNLAAGASVFDSVKTPSININDGATSHTLTTTGGTLNFDGSVVRTGTVGVANGGTGATTAQAARTALLPSQASKANRVMTSDGTDVGFNSYSTLDNSTGDFITQGRVGAANLTTTGKLAVGTSLQGNQIMTVAGTASGGVSAYGVNNATVVGSGVTSRYVGYATNISTAAESFTCTDLIHNYATQGAIGAGSSVSYQYGFYAQNNLVGATNNYGFYANIPAGAGRWNFYAGGSAKNYFNGATLIGTTTDDGTSKLQVNGDITTTGSVYYGTKWAWSTMRVWDNGNGAIRQDANTSIALISNAYYNGTNWIAKATNPSMDVGLTTGGDLVVNTTGSVTAGSAFATYAERLRLTNAGRFTLNTATAGDTGRLTVNIANTGTPAMEVRSWATGGASRLGARDTLLMGSGANTTNGGNVKISFAHNDALTLEGAIILSAKNSANGTVDLATFSNYGVCVGHLGELINDPGSLQIYGSAGAMYIKRPSTTNYWQYKHNASNQLLIANDSGVGVVLSNGSTAWAALSDRRKKTDLVDITNALDKVCSLGAYTGRYITDAVGTSRSFLIAQDVQQVLPEAVSEDNEGTLSLAYSDTIPLLVAAIKDLKTEIDNLKAEIVKLKGAA